LNHNAGQPNAYTTVSVAIRFLDHTLLLFLYIIQAPSKP
jgi:hypothetical protein